MPFSPLQFCSQHREQLRSPPDSSNYFGQYEIDGSIDAAEYLWIFVANDPSLNAGEVMDITFPAGTILPSSIDPSKIIVTGVSNFDETNSSPASAVSISGQTVSITIPVNMGEGTDFTVKFLTSAKVRNPDPGTGFTISYNTPKQAANTTSGYDVVASNTELQPASVSVFPSVENTYADYSIAFVTGRGGYLETGQVVTIEFPAGIQMPDGNITGTAIKVDNVATSGVADSTNKTIQVTLPNDVSNNLAVIISFDSGLNIRNPISGNYTLSVYSEVETTPITSNSFTVTPVGATSVQRILLSDNNANARSAYDIDFKLGTVNDLTTSDQVELTFPGSTRVPSSINTELITISGGGFTGNPDAVTTSGNTITLDVPFLIAAGSDINVNIETGANILNPLNQGSYSLDLELSSNPGTIITSNPYLIRQPETAVSQANITLANTSDGATTNYTVGFNAGSYGRLVGGTSSVEIVFPSGTTFGALSGTMNGTAISSFSTSGTEVTIDVPASVDVSNGGAVTLVINNITNPTAGSYTLSISTSSEPVESVSNQYLIGAFALNFQSLSLNSGLVNSSEQFVLQFSTNRDHYYRDRTLFNTEVFDYFRVIFPDGTELPSTVGTGDVQIQYNGTNYTPEDVVVNQAYRYVDVYVMDRIGGGGSDIPNGSTVQLRFLTSGGIKNPSVPSSNYKLIFYSSAELEQVETSTYTLNSNNVAVTAGTATAFPNSINTSSVKLEIPIDLGANGKLVGGIESGSNTVTLNFPNPILVPGAINPSDIKINGNALEDVTINSSGAGGVITFSIPDGDIIQSSSTANVLITANAGFDIDNISVSNPYQILISTTAESTASNDNNLTLQDVSNLTITQVVNSPRGINQSAAYSFDLLLGSVGALAAGNQIWLDFPDNTLIPTQSGDPTAPDFSTANVLVNGANPTSMEVSGQVLKLILSESLSANTPYTINLSSNAGILNPSTPGTSYSIDMSTYQTDGTTVIESAVSSPTYEIQSASSSISNVVVSLSDNTFSAVSNYTVTFRTGTSGRLIAGSSTITLNFPYAVSPSAVSVNGVAASGTMVTTTRGEITVPNGVSISNDEIVTIEISGITNPASGGSYSLTAETSVEPTAVTSSSYNISSVNSSVAFQSLTVSTDTVNQAFGMDFSIATNEIATVLAVVFPTSVSMPSTIGIGDITVNGLLSTSIIVQPGNNLILITNLALGTTGTMNVSISPNAGLRNPQLPGEYGISVYSNIESSTINSVDNGQSYMIYPSINTQLQILAIDNTPKVAGAPQAWNWTLQTGPLGALQPGAGLIKLIFPLGRINAPASVSKSAIEINGQNPAQVNFSADTLILKVPSNVAIGNNSIINLTIDESANVYVTSANKQTAGKASYGASGGTIPSTMDAQNYGASSSSETNASTLLTNPLPVELASFGTRSAGQGFDEYAVLSWTTATERENNGFYVERRFVRGLTEDVHVDSTWSEIVFIKGQGFSTESVTYTFEDKSLQTAGKYEYRLIQEDYDGTKTTFDEIEFQFASPHKAGLFANYPNPFNPTTTIPYSVSVNGDVRMEVFNILGQRVRVLVNQELAPGRYSANFDARTLSSGVYFLRMVTGGEVFTRKMLLVK